MCVCACVRACMCVCVCGGGGVCVSVCWLVGWLVVRSIELFERLYCKAC